MLLRGFRVRIELGVLSRETQGIRISSLGFRLYDWGLVFKDLAQSYHEPRHL